MECAIFSTTVKGSVMSAKQLALKCKGLGGAPATSNTNPWLKLWQPSWIITVILELGCHHTTLTTGSEEPMLPDLDQRSLQIPGVA